jgi:hypothetical protein
MWLGPELFAADPTNKEALEQADIYLLKEICFGN